MQSIKRISVVLVVFVVLGCDGTTTTVEEIRKSPSRFDASKVVVTGQVTGLQKRTSKAGDPFTLFRLNDRGCRALVFSFGHLDLANGNKVRVSGTFAVTEVTKGLSFRNVIDASRERGGSISRL